MEDLAMLKIADFRCYAEECRRLAAQPGSAHLRAQLIDMAEAWEDLAEEREHQLKKSGKLDD
jgi:hypothetical protein